MPCPRSVYPSKPSYSRFRLDAHITDSMDLAGCNNNFKLNQLKKDEEKALLLKRYTRTQQQRMTQQQEEEEED